MRVWNKSHYGSIMLHGHSHGSLPGTNQSLDVGVDCWDYTPVTLEQIKRRLKSLPPFSPVDHHGRK
jgi:calcineurin-like phosphoesterase family protein